MMQPWWTGTRAQTADDQQLMYSQFPQQLVHHPEGWCETGLLRKARLPPNPPPPDNQKGNLARLSNLIKKLQKVPSHLDEYDKIIQNQLKQGIVERVSDETQRERECYLLHKAVIREAARSTKMRIVFDAWAKVNQRGPSMKDCFETGPPLQICSGVWWLGTVSNQLPCVKTLLSRPSCRCRLKKQIVTPFDFTG